MNETQLSYFLAVFDAGGYSAAANATFASRQVLGRSVSELEREIGGKLFERKGRSIVPTPLGVESADIARTILENMSRLKSLSNPEASKESEKPFVIAVSMHGARGASYAPKALQAFAQAEFPNYRIVVEELPCESCEGALKAGLVDIVITLGQAVSPFLTSRLLGTRKPFLAISANHPLAQRKELALDDIKDVAIAQPASLSYMLPHLNELCSERGFMPKWRYAGKDAESMLTFIENGGAVILCENSPLIAGSKTIKLLPFKKSAKLDLPFYCIYRNGHTLHENGMVLERFKELFR